VLRNLACKRVQLDEIWNFVYAKEANLATATAAPDDAGDIWTWTAICADTKLLVTFLVGGRDTNYAIAFVDDLKERLANRVQVTSDGHGAYLRAVFVKDYAALLREEDEPDPRMRLRLPAHPASGTITTSMCSPMVSWSAAS
jgi:hypothetical protein